MSRARTAILCLSLAWLIAGCGDRASTGIVVELSTDSDVPGRIDAVAVKVWRPGRTEPVVDQRWALQGPGAVCLPARLALTPGDPAPTGELVVEVTGLKSAPGRDPDLVVKSRARVAFSPGRIGVLHMPLFAGCIGFRDCGPDESCGEGAGGEPTCQPARRTSQSLPVYVRARDPGPACALDAGPGEPDAGADARMMLPPDGSAVDGAPPDRPARDDAAAGEVADAAADTGGFQGGADVPVDVAVDSLPGLPIGKACREPGQCESGYCVNDVCCDAICTGLCVACIQARTDRPSGHCAPVLAGTDPGNHCDRATAACGDNGLCDGAGACQKAGVDVECAVADCSGSQYTPRRTCDGRGKCADPMPSFCGSYICTPIGCRTSCGNNLDCVSPSTCVNKVCGGKKPNGESCGSAMECSSGFCADGVCCGSACTELCRSCRESKTGAPDGVCQFVKAGDDPRDSCSAETAACGFDGACDGAGACRRRPPGTMCGEAGCQGNVHVAAPTCNGQGACLMMSPTSCGLYTCVASGCPSACQNDTQCTSAAYCEGTSCVPRKGGGAACSRDRECASGSCGVLILGICSG